MRLVKYLKETPVLTGSMAPTGSGTEVIREPYRAKELVPPKKMRYKYRFEKKGKRMSATKPEEKKTTAKTHFGGIKDVERYDAWTNVGQTTSSPTGWNR